MGVLARRHDNKSGKLVSLDKVILDRCTVGDWSPDGL